MFRAVAIGILLLEVLLISLSFDAQPLQQLFEGEAGFLFSHLSLVIVWLSAYFGAFLIVLLTHDKTETALHNNSDAHLKNRVTARLAITLIIVNLVLYAGFYGLTKALFTQPPETTTIFWSLFAAWVLLAACVFLTCSAVVYPIQTWFARMYRNRATIIISASIATVVTSTSLLAKNLWPSFIAPTFHLSEKILFTVFGEVHSDPENLNLGIDYFVVNISSECSGIEGMGLAFCFTVLYLFLYRQQLRFPIALILLPIALSISWLLNVIRICMLIFIGEFIDRDFAIGGFHSQAGWFTFIALALLIIYVFDRLPFIKKKTAELTPTSSYTANDSAAENTDQTATAIIGVFIVFLLCSLIAGFDEGIPNWLYPVKALGTAVAIVYFWQRFPLKPSYKLSFSFWLETLLLGLITAVLWVLLIPEDSDYNAQLVEGFGQQSALMTTIWIVIRCFGSIIVAPIVEELMFRGYLLSRISGHSIKNSAPAVSLMAVAVSSLAFGFIHSQWLAGTLAGLIYALARYRYGLTSAVFCHAITNGALCVYALGFGQWSYL